MTTQKVKMLNYVAIALMLFGIAGGVWSSSIWSQYLRTLSRTPNAALKRIYPRNIHGIVVYQTYAERTRLNTIEYSSAGLFLLGLLIGGILEEQRGRRKGRVS